MSCSSRGGTSGGTPYPGGYLHQNPPEHKTLFDGDECLVCHCGETDTPCGVAHVETNCCIDCHDLCLEVIVHTVKHGYDCGECHFPPGDPGECADPIPTLSEWGIIIFMTIIMGIGVLMIIRKRRRA